MHDDSPNRLRDAEERLEEVLRRLSPYDTPRQAAPEPQRRGWTDTNLLTTEDARKALDRAIAGSSEDSAQTVC